MTHYRHLSPHFTLHILTRTDHADLQEENRHVAPDEELRLTALANLLETVMVILGCDLDIHSARRYLALNKRVGGTERSEHLKCTAADGSPVGPDTQETIDAAVVKIVAAAKAGKIKFGQLISESDARGREGRKCWFHISLGEPYRDKARCGEVLKMVDGKYTVVERIS
jgi:hypothetical protein